MKKIYLILLAILFVGAGTQSIKATHVAGGDVSYECIGPNQFRVIVKFFRDCSGVPAPGSISVNFTNTCGLPNQNLVAPLVDPFTGLPCPGAVESCATEISQLCPQEQANSTCSTPGGLPGMQMYKYVTEVTLAGQCNTWTISYSVSARNCCNNLSTCTTGSGDTFYTEATLNSQNAPCNNSPIFTAQPIPYVCTNQLVNYSFGVIEIDGDSLVYQLVQPKNSVAGVCNYTVPYDATNPIASSQLPVATVLNFETGLLNFIPTTPGIWVFAVRVNEYNPITQQLKGSSTRDIQFIVQNCSNDVPSPWAGQITTLTGSATQTGPFNIEMCEGQNFCFTALFHDTNAVDTLTALSNAFLSLPGSSMTTSGINPISVNLCWTAPPGSALTNSAFTIVIKDDACPIVGTQTFVYNVFVSASTGAGPDTTICGAMEAHLHATNGTSFVWTALPGGDPIDTLTNFSSTVSANPIATPSITTTYVVTSDLTSTCSNTDTVTVFVINSFNHTLDVDDASVCLGQSSQFNLNMTSPGTYTYGWTPTTYLNNSAIANPTATFTTPGTYEYFVEMTNQFGCNETDSITVIVSPNWPIPATASITNNLFCAGDSAQLGVAWGGGTPPSCAVSVVPVCAVPNVFTLGTGTTPTSPNPSPFTGQFDDGRMQIMVKTSELNAIGFTGGVLRGISLYVQTKSSTQPFSNFTVKVGCTSATSMTTTFVGGLTTVLGPSAFSSVVGWNTINFTTMYDWNGIDNLVFEFCYDNSSGTFSDVLRMMNTGYTCGVSNFDFGPSSVPGCNLAGSSLYTMRPQMQIRTCNYPLDTIPLTVQWRPINMVSNYLAHNPWTQNTVNVVDTLIITDPSTGCVTKDTILVRIATPAPNAGVDTGVCVGSSIQLLVTGNSLDTYLWLPSMDLDNDQIANPTIANLSATTTFTVLVTDSSGCQDTDEVLVTLHQLPVASITSLDPTYCSTAAFDPIVGNPAGGTFTGPGTLFSGGNWYYNAATANIGFNTIVYDYTDAFGCNDTAQASTTVIEFNGGVPINYTIPSFLYCVNSPSVTMIPNVTGGSFLINGTPITGTTFDPSIVGAGSHSVCFVFSDINACVDTFCQTITVEPLPTLVINNLPANFCVGDPGVILTATPAGGTFTIDGAPTNTVTTNVTGSHTVVYSYTSTTGALCSNTLTQNFTVNALPLVNAGSDVSICSGRTHLLSATGADTYVWTPSVNVANPNAAQTPATPLFTTTYTVTGTTASGCANTDAITVSITPNPEVLISGTPETGTAPLEVQFSSTVSNGSVFNWNFGDNGTSSIATPTHTYDQAGDFIVTLTVSSADLECTNSDSMIVMVNDSIIIVQYNVFTPDGDGDNDLFQVKTIGIESIDVEIFNRWGKKIGEYSGVSNGWDGKTATGRGADDGVYFYIARAVGFDKQVYSDLKGFFHLVNKQ